MTQAARHGTLLAAAACAAPQIVSAALALLVVVQLVSLARVLAPSFTEDRASSPRAAPRENPARDGAGFDALVEAHLFGEAAVAPPQATATITEAPATALDSTLTGILFDDSGAASQAIIADGTVERTFRPGERLASGDARLHAVYADRVILERGGNLETLRPPDWQTLGAPPLMVEAAPLPEAMPVAELEPELDAPPEGAWTPERRFGEGPLASVIRVIGYKQDPVVGLEVSAGRDPQAFRALGLRSGDVITKVNGASLGAQDGATLQNALQSGELVTLSLARNGLPQDLIVSSAAVADRLAEP